MEMAKPRSRRRGEDGIGNGGASRGCGEGLIGRTATASANQERKKGEGRKRKEEKYFRGNENFYRRVFIFFFSRK